MGSVARARRNPRRSPETGRARGVLFDGSSAWASLYPGSAKSILKLERAKRPKLDGIPGHPTQVTGLLQKWGQGDEAALERLIPLVHGELHRIAERHMAHERADHSLQATALV